MGKRMYDIVPPGVSKSKSKKATAVPVRIKRTAWTERPAAAPKTGRRSAGRGLSHSWKLSAAGVGVIALIAAAGYAYFALASATIRITPKVEAASYDAPALTVDSAAQQFDSAKGVIPARMISQEQKGSQQFPATGDASNKAVATGIIHVYNKATPAAPVTLRAGTHFLSDSGKYFVTDRAVTIPAMRGSTPGAASVGAHAQESGPEYNIGPAKFSVPKLSGTAYYYGIWGESTSAMTGGASGQVTEVTSEDIAQAEDTFSKQLAQQATDALKKQLAPGETLIDGLTDASVSSERSDTNAGTAADRFTVSAMETVTGLVVKQSDLDSWAHAYLASKLAKGVASAPGTEQVSYQVASFDVSKGVASINAHVSAKTYQSIDQSSLASRAQGKTAAQIEQQVTGQYGDSITSVTATLSPFWALHAPRNVKRIHISFNFPS